MTCKDCVHYVVCEVHERVNRIKANLCGLFKNKADVVEVKHGEWMPDYETFVDEWERESEPVQTGWVCSLCGRQEWKEEPYCHCGADMRKEGADNG
jgi:hypothetical protein